MITRLILPTEKELYNSVAGHPVQTWEWGEFQISQGHKIYRLGIFDNEKIVGSYTVSFHKIPRVNYSVGTILRGPRVDQDMIDAVTKLAKENNAIFVKFEPDVHQKIFDEFNNSKNLIIDTNFKNFVISPKVAFYPYSYIVDLSKNESELLLSLHSKTRYNIKVANRHGVVVQEMTNDQGFEIYLKLLFDTTRRQGFYLHSESYHRDLWNILKPTGMAHIFIAFFNGQPLSAFMIFTLHDTLYYPYGASAHTNREVMAPNLLMWEVIKFGQKTGLKSFDMWGSLGPDAKETEPGYGFHRFKQGYGGQLVQFVGTYDLVINQPLYKIYNIIDKLRWKLLRLKAKILR